MSQAKPTITKSQGLGARLTSFVTPSHWPRPKGPADPWLFGTVVAVIALGVVMVYSASSVRAERLYENGWYFLVRQFVFALMGTPLIVVVARIDYHRYRAVTHLGLLITFGLLGFVVIVGRVAGGAARWIDLGPVNLQPAELAKLVMIFWLAHSLARKQGRMGEFMVGFMPQMLMAGAFAALCMLQPDFGSSVMIVLLTFVLVFVAGGNVLHMALGVVVGSALAAYAVWGKAYRLRRLTAFLHPEEHRMDGAYQLVESWNSFGAGGLTGVGLGDSRQKLFFLPEAHTDFIAAIVGEELGFVGFSLLLLAYVVIVSRGLWAAHRAVDSYGGFLATGISLFLGLQAFTNFAVVLGLLPTKGLTLPFVSYGGSSLLVNCAAVGVLLNVSRPREPVPQARPEVCAPQRRKGQRTNARVDEVDAETAPVGA